MSGAGFTVDQSTGVVFTQGTGFDFETGTTSFMATIRALDNPQGSPQMTVMGRLYGLAMCIVKRGLYYDTAWT